MTQHRPRLPRAVAVDALAVVALAGAGVLLAACGPSARSDAASQVGTPASTPPTSAAASAGPPGADLHAELVRSEGVPGADGVVLYSFTMSVVNDGPEVASGVRYTITNIYEYGSGGGTAANTYDSSNRADFHNEEPDGEVDHLSLDEPLAVGDAFRIDGTARVSPGSRLAMVLTGLSGAPADPDPTDDGAELVFAP